MAWPLEAGEKLLWEGQPDARRRFWSELPANCFQGVLGSALGAGCTIFLPFALFSRENRGLLSEWPLMVTAALWAPWAPLYESGRTSYAITNRRVLVRTGERVEGIALDEVREVGRGEMRGSVGAVHLHLEDSVMERERLPFLSLDWVPEPALVEETLRKAIAAREPSIA